MIEQQADLNPTGSGRRQGTDKTLQQRATGDQIHLHQHAGRGLVDRLEHRLEKAVAIHQKPDLVVVSPIEFGPHLSLFSANSTQRL